MNPATYRYQILLGKISKINGYTGSVSVKLEEHFFDNLPDMESLFIEIEGRAVPFFILSYEYSGGDILKLKFERYDTFEKINEFLGCRIFLTTVNDQQSLTKETENISGFKVLSYNNGLIGTIKEVSQNPGHDLLKIISADKKEVLIPFHTDFITEVDYGKKTITVQLPEGLLEVNK